MRVGAVAGAAPRAGAGRRAHPAVSRLAVLAAGAAASAYLYRTDPHQPGHWLPFCPFHRLTGLLCPLCGTTRMGYDLMHRRLGAAWHDNTLALLASPVAVLVLARWTAEGLRGTRWRPVLRRRGTILVVAAAVAWTVVRNVF
ncbi:DUF2752 domain-containing protein [Streptantibioticus silvisoli]|uniref:DUF2752 domain-containing protein n=1 Tax=Streptantibioticus silvisoli TaxID=2705255 RepID=A0ABT6W463_9ACTN|nr:DUF2752 domain-containing protein [Streptantibioticus silvisoli]MDI5965525.1 DUF2752 domain-containing protein [Streptantibioticus silvisoli]